MHGVVFKTCKFASFVRNLNKYGFRKTGADGKHLQKSYFIDKAEKHVSGSWVYFKHPYFRRFDPGYVHQSRIMVVPPLKSFAPPLMLLEECDLVPPPVMMLSEGGMMQESESGIKGKNWRSRPSIDMEDTTHEQKRPKTELEVCETLIDLDET